MRKLALSLAMAVLVVGCASGAGPDRATDRACKELKAADDAMTAALGDQAGEDLGRVGAVRSGPLAGFSAQLRVVATDAQGGALASTLGTLGVAADDWDAAWQARNRPALVVVGDRVSRSLDACRGAGVSL